MNDKAIEDYKKGKVTFGKAVSQTGKNYWELLDICHKRKIPLNISQEDIDQGFRTIRDLNLTEYLDKIKK